MKVYLSIPISGRNITEARKQANSIKSNLMSQGHEVVTPFDIHPKQDKTLAHYMGKDIEALLECEAIYLAPGWQSSKGCCVEYHVAKTYDIEILK